MRWRWYVAMRFSSLSVAATVTLGIPVHFEASDVATLWIADDAAVPIRIELSMCGEYYNAHISKSRLHRAAQAAHHPRAEWLPN
jgi:hypothetical protein